MAYCKQCGIELNENQEVCTNCGFKKGKGNSYCPTCGVSILPEQDICINCGKKLTEETPVINNENFVDYEKKARNSLIFGLIGLIAWFIPLFGYPIGILALVNGLKGLKGINKVLAIAGIILSCICLILSLCNSIAGVLNNLSQY